MKNGVRALKAPDAKDPQSMTFLTPNNLQR